jgi:hypothetical protein
MNNFIMFKNSVLLNSSHITVLINLFDLNWKRVIMIIKNTFRNRLKIIQVGVGMFQPPTASRIQTNLPSLLTLFSYFLGNLI